MQERKIVAIFVCMATKGQNRTVVARRNAGQDGLADRSLAEIRAEIDGIDAQMAELFGKRMELVREIARVKRAHGLPVEDKVREEQIIADNSLRIADPQIREQYIRLEKTLIEISKNLQEAELTDD